MIHLKECPLCKNTSLKVVYEGPVRSAQPGSPYVDGHKVNGCDACGAIFLNPVPDAVDALYNEGDYWSARTDDLNKKEFVDKHIREQVLWLEKIGAEEFTGESVLDVGCGHGLFLNLIKGIAKRTAGIDIDRKLAGHVEGNGHEFYTSWPNSDIKPFSRIVMFDTLEHIDAPISFLEKANSLLEPGGKVIVGVPNGEDFMTQVVDEYKPFFYRRGHLFYFNKNSLSYSIKNAGFNLISVGHVHKYNIMNLIGWSKYKKPQGVPPTIFDHITEGMFASNLEREGKASHLLAIAEKRVGNQ